jgi:hypothetical protein
MLLQGQTLNIQNTQSILMLNNHQSRTSVNHNKDLLLVFLKNQKHLMSMSFMNHQVQH